MLPLIIPALKVIGIIGGIGFIAKSAVEVVSHPKAKAFGNEAKNRLATWKNREKVSTKEAGGTQEQGAPAQDMDKEPVPSGPRETLNHENAAVMVTALNLTKAELNVLGQTVVNLKKAA
jgi:hypothetical protein